MTSRGDCLCATPTEGLPQTPFFSPVCAIPNIKVERTSRKDARTSEKPILSHLKLPFIIITFRKLSFHMVFILILKSGDNKMYLTREHCKIEAKILLRLVFDLNSGNYFKIELNDFCCN
jgi:hypothetical protein